MVVKVLFFSIKKEQRTGNECDYHCISYSLELNSLNKNVY